MAETLGLCLHVNQFSQVTYYMELKTQGHWMQALLSVERLLKFNQFCIGHFILRLQVVKR